MVCTKLRTIFRFQVVFLQKLMLKKLTWFCLNCRFFQLSEVANLLMKTLMNARGEDSGFFIVAFLFIAFIVIGLLYAFKNNFPVVYLVC